MRPRSQRYRQCTPLKGSKLKKPARRLIGSRGILSKREIALPGREISAVSLACSCSTRDVPLLRGVGRGSRLNSGAEFAPKILGGRNDLEDPENCRSAGGHGNQHVRLRSAEIGCLETIGSARSVIPASSRGRRPAGVFKHGTGARLSLSESSESRLCRGHKIGRRDVALLEVLTRVNMPAGGQRRYSFRRS